MPEVTYPGVYICETGAPTPITGVSTSIAAFVGGALAGPLDQPIRIRSFVEYERTFGGIGGADPLGPVVKQYFDNGGTDAVIVRVQASPGAGATDAAIAGRGLRAARRGIFALEASDGFDLLCIPPPTPDRDVAPRTWERARRLCAARGALLLVDPPREWTSVAAARAGATSLLARDPNALVYFPRLVAPDARQCDRPADFGPCGAVAGVIARTDATRGVWKAPAGPDAILRGGTGLTVEIDDAAAGELAALGINALRQFHGQAPVVWGARTWAADDDWKYVNVRRLFLYVERSIFRGTQWVVFEPNDATLWARLRTQVTDFLNGLWRQGALIGAKAEDAYFVRCDAGTTSAADVARGVTNVHVGLAALKPAEFTTTTLALRARRPVA